MRLLREGKAGGIRTEVSETVPTGEDDAAVLFPDPLGHQKARMPADGVVHRLVSPVFHQPVDMQQARVLCIERVLHGETEFIGIDLPRSLGRQETVRDGRGGLFHTGKVHVAGKTVLGLHRVFPPADAVFPVRHSAHKGKENRRMAVPDRRVGGPETLGAGSFVQNAAELGACIRHAEPEGFVFKKMTAHEIVPFRSFYMMVFLCISRPRRHRAGRENGRVRGV